MDIKGILNAVVPLGFLSKGKVDKTIKSDSTADRDANGQMPGKGQGDHHPPMSEDQLKKAMNHLKALDVVKEHGLVLELLAEKGEKRFVLLKDPEGKIIRRIAEEELWSLQEVNNSEKGQLLRKTA